MSEDHFENVVREMQEENVIVVNTEQASETGA